MKKFLVLVCLSLFCVPFTLSAATFTFTDDADWDLGLYTSTNSGPPGADDQLQLNPNILTPFNHIWVALSGRNGVVRINTDHQEADGVVTLADSAAGNGAVYGEYLSRPDGMGGDPSRTTVDQNGDVWVGNRAETSGGKGSIVKISATPEGTTSTGTWNGSTFDRLAWSNAGGVDSLGGTSTATDSAISQYVRTAGTAVRTIAIDADNNVWAGGFNNKQHQKYDGDTGAALSDVEYINPGGYGGLIDGNGVLWSSGWSDNRIARYDPATDSLSFAVGTHSSYGLGIDSQGNIWNTSLSNLVSKFDSDGNRIGTYTLTGSGSRGVAVTADDNIWTANSSSSNVTRLDNNGNFVATIAVGSMPTGVAVDSNGKVWVTNYNSNSVMRIDPMTNLVDLTIDLGPRANPYNYSDMTGTVVTGTTNPTGTWRYVQDGGTFNLEWDQISWTELLPEGAGLTIQARAADTLAGLDGLAYTTYSLMSGESLGQFGRYLEVKATFTRAGMDGLSPILYDLTFTSKDSQHVPEPSSLLLFAIGGLTLIGSKLRRRKQ